MRGVDTRTFAAEIGTWLDSNRLDLQGQQGEIATWRLYNRLDPYLSLYWKEGIGVGGVDTTYKSVHIPSEIATWWHYIRPEWCLGASMSLTLPSLKTYFLIRNVGLVAYSRSGQQVILSNNSVKVFTYFILTAG